MNRVDWQTLKSEFVLNQTHKEVRPWLREIKKWSDARLNNGNTKAHTSGWSTERAQVQHQIYAESLDALKEAQKRKVIDVIGAKQLAIDKLVQHTKESTTLKDTILCLRALQSEIDTNHDIVNGGNESEDALAAVRELIDSVNRATTLSSKSAS